MSDFSLKTPHWQGLWTKAREAREAGAVGSTLALFEQTLAENPPAEAFAGAADFAVYLEHGLAPLEELYRNHRAAFDLAPNDMSFRPQGFPIDGEGLRQSVRKLEIATEHDRDNPIYPQRLAEIQEELGHIEAALACRRRIAQSFPAIEANHAAIAILLERSGATDEALGYCEGLIAGRAALDPPVVLCLARLYERAGRHVAAELLGKRLTGTVAGDDPAAFTTLFRFAWSAANDGLPAVEWPRKLLLRAIEMAQKPKAAIEAALAAGFATDILRDENSSRKYFAAACWKAYEKFGTFTPPSASRELRHALTYAARKVLHLAPRPMSNDGPPVAARHLLLACARVLQKDRTLNENLVCYGAAFAATLDLPESSPLELSKVYRGYRIIARGNQYYALPLWLTHCVIIHGTVYRVPGKARIAMELCPPRFRQSLRRILVRLRPRLSNVNLETLGVVRTAAVASGGLFAGLFSLFTVHDVFKATDVLALYDEIDLALRTRSSLRMSLRQNPSTAAP